MTATSLINNNENNSEKDSCILKSLNLTSRKMKNNGELNGQQQLQLQQQQQHLLHEQHNTKNEVEEGEIDCNAYDDGETSSTSADWKAFRWTPESTRVMLRLRFERNVEFHLRIRQKKDLWAEIAMEMRKEGNYHTTGEVCDLKYRNMLQTYKKNYLKEERGMQSQIVWEYYDLFKEAMKSCAASADDLVPSQLCDTICENGQPQVVDVKEEEEDFNEDEDASDCIEISNTSGVKLDNNNHMQPKRRAPSARVQAKNNKRYRLTSSNQEPVICATTATTATNTNTMGVMPNEFDWSQLPPLEPKPDTMAAMTTVNSSQHPPPQPPALKQQAVPILQNYTTSHHINNYPVAPPWLTDSELREYFSFGESVGLQIAHVRDPRTRAFLQLKIQETLFLAKVGRLTE